MPCETSLKANPQKSELSTLVDELQDRKNCLAKTHGRGEKKLISKQILQIKRDIRRNLKQTSEIV